MASLFSFFLKKRIVVRISDSLDEVPGVDWMYPFGHSWEFCDGSCRSDRPGLDRSRDHELPGVKGGVSFDHIDEAFEPFLEFNTVGYIRPLDSVMSRPFLDAEEADADPSISVWVIRHLRRWL